MRVLGIDPGTVRMGIGVVDDSGGRYKLVHYDVLKMSSSENICVRLGKIFKFVKEQIKEHNVDAVAIEDVFMSVNARSALKLGQGRGAAIAAAIDAGKDKAPLYLGEARSVLEATNIPYKIDLVDLNSISSELFEIIKKEGIQLN